MFKSNIKYTALAAMACTALAVPASAEMIKYTADLTADAQVPPVDSTAAGTADVTVDTEAKTVTWMVNFEGLTGDATAAHIHGPASDGENANPVITLADTIMEGQGEITDEQISELNDGKYYVNVHTDQNPGGEIRGQLSKAE